MLTNIMNIRRCGVPDGRAGRNYLSQESYQECWKWYEHMPGLVRLVLKRCLKVVDVRRQGSSCLVRDKVRVIR